MFLDSKFMCWDTDISSHRIIDKTVVNRGEELLFRSEQLLGRENTREARAECILSLKRCLNNRLKAIESIYGFKKMYFPNQPKGYLEILELVGIVRPLLLKNMMKIRNSIEHEDTVPPSFNKCREIVDTVWYFLKTTNNIVSYEPLGIVFQRTKPNDNYFQYWVECRSADSSFSTIKVNGWVPKSHLRKKSSKLGFLKLDVMDIGTKAERWPSGDEGYHSDKLPTDVWIDGSISLTAENRLRLLKKLMCGKHL